MGLLADGKIDVDDFKFLMRGVRSQLVAEAAVQRGQALRDVRSFLEKAVSVILTEVLKAVARSL
jgi:hypothetical protein